MNLVKISELTSVETPVLTDILPIVNDDETKAITLEQIINVTKANITILNVKQVAGKEDVVEENILYLVPGSSESENIYDEYLLVNGVPERLGPQKVDLSDYTTTKDVEQMISDSITSALEGEY